MKISLPCGGKFIIPRTNSVLTGTLRTDILAVIVKELLLKSKQVPEENTKVLLLTMGNQKIPCKDCIDKKFLVYIDSAADGIGFSNNASLLPDSEERP